jgi:peptidyl-dipeptidase A
MHVHRDPAIQALLDETLPLLREHSIAVSRASWVQATTGSPEAAATLGARQKGFKLFLSSQERFGRLKDLRAAGSSDPVLARQFEILYRTMLGNQLTETEIAESVALETELKQLFNTFRADFEGAPTADNDLADVLRTETASARRQAAWLAAKQIGTHSSAKVRQLARVRNATAQRLGYRDYFAMALDLQEINEAELFEILEKLYAATEPAFLSEKGALDAELAERFGVPATELFPWHYHDFFFQSAPPSKNGPDLDKQFAAMDVAQLSIEFYDQIGLEVRDILGRSSLYEQPGKMQHAFCTNIDREGDVRILCNLKNNTRWMETQLHELGHAVYDKYVDPGIPWLLKRPAHTMTTEAIAMLMGRLTNNAHWLTAFAGMNPTEAQAAQAQLHGQEKRNQLTFARWGMVMTYFERALYANPEGDLGALWWQLVERFQHLRRPAEGDRNHDWATKIHVANYPVYYHNYILGELTASQLQAALEAKLGPTWMLTPESGAWLWQRVFRPGNLLSWQERLVAATGEPLNPRHFVQQFC